MGEMVATSINISILVSAFVIKHVGWGVGPGGRQGGKDDLTTPATRRDSLAWWRDGGRGAYNYKYCPPAGSRRSAGPWWQGGSGRYFQVLISLSVRVSVIINIIMGWGEVT